MLVKSSYELTHDNILRAVKYIIRMVFPLIKYYHEADSNLKKTIIKHLYESYKYECHMHNKLVPVEQYIYETEKSIGWDWVLPEEQQ
jgi:hypothetical protein